jgi:hypothetical protein
MRAEDILWVRNNILLLTTSRRYAVGELQRIFDIYNNITNENKKVTSCGRCVTTVKNLIMHNYNKL